MNQIIYNVCVCVCMCLHIWLKMWKTHHQRLCPNKNGNRNLGKMRNSSASWLSIMLAKLLRISLPFCDFCDLILKASKNHYINSRSLDVPRLLWFSSWASARAHRLVQHGRPRHKWHRTSPSSGEMTKPIPCSATASGSKGQIVHWLKGKFTENPHFYLRLKLRRLPLRSFLNQCWESGVGITSASPKCQGAQASSQATRAFSSSAFMQSCGSIHRSRSQTAWESQLWRPHGYGSKGHE